jgi:allantoate deiminase
MALSINGERLRSRLETLSRFNSTPGEGITRFSYSPEDAKAREYILSLFEEAGLKVSVDGAGNMRARLEGSVPDAPAVISGSHIDTVLHGGPYDGAVGTLGALEAVQAIAESGLPHRHPVEVIVFAEEEGSNFGSTLAGSKTLVGKYGVDDMKKLKDREGRSMYDLAKAAGYDPDSMPEFLLRPETVKAMIELHIEQSVLLESKGVPLGIVEAVAGIKAVEIRLKGVPNHAGATPMSLRQDPMVAAAHLIASIETLARGTGTGSTVATVGKISCFPNVSNIIPGEVRFFVDIRDVVQSGIESVLDGLAVIGQAVAASRGVVLEIVLVSESAPVVLDGNVLSVIEECAKKKEFIYHRMNSGAVHDACMLAPLVPTGMIFIPSRGGRSHVPEEHTDHEDIEKGAALLADALLELSI